MSEAEMMKERREISRLEKQASIQRKVSSELLDATEEIFIDFSTCPFCNDYIQPPSYCCENGHFICCSCKEQVKKCPTCGTENFPNKKNLIFDSILKEVDYPCYYQANGCAAYFKYNELKLHEINCHFKLEPCAFKSAGCPMYLKYNEKSSHEATCEYGVSCRIYAKIKGTILTHCTWRGPKQQLPLHVTKFHQVAWCPHQIESNVALSWMLPLNFDFEKVELIKLKDIDELFYFYSKSIQNSQHFVAVQYIGNNSNWQEFLYSVEFSYESKKVSFEDLVIPYDVCEEDIFRSISCFSVDYSFLKKHFLAEGVIDCYVKVFKKEQKDMQTKPCLTFIGNLFKEE